MKRLTLAIGAVLSGCAPTIAASNSAGGIINMNQMPAGQRKAMVQADAECQKFGKVARSTGINEIRNTLRYECVAP